MTMRYSRLIGECLRDVVNGVTVGKNGTCAAEERGETVKLDFPP